ncbi:hypothetical protein BFS35_000150 [Macrococcoides goetzii]|uniref:DUF2975 domain-containing protein n=1 Tax=Macrococcoides goetzii TaxID=1891097 RepID=A0A2G5NNT0_9STAP|nr:hypothetical protein [Macrococcus goetzii]RAI82130.1 hypothetical protein BFS35_000150 [Macrococcus goetzii]
MSNSNKSLTFTKYFIVMTFIIASLSALFTISDFFSKPISNNLLNLSNKGLYYFLAYAIQMLIILTILILAYQLVLNINIKDYFNTINYDKLLLIAILTIIYGVLNLLKKYLNITPEYRSLLDTTVDTNQLLFLLSLVILTSLSIYEESKKIKEENDLTI